MPLKKIYGNEFNAAPAAGRTILLDIDDGTPKILQGIFLRGVGYSASTGELILSNVVDRIRILQDTQEKAIFIPSLQRKLDDFLNANADTLKTQFMYIPFNRYLDAGRGWGTGNIGKLYLEVKVIDTYPANTAFTDLKAILGYNDIPAKLNRGNVYVQTVLPQPAPNAGWNQINDLQYYGITHLTKLLFDNPAITEVEIYRGSDLRYQMKKCDQLFELQINPLFKVPSTCTHLEVTGQANASTGPFPAFLDSFGNPGDALPLFRDGERQQLKVRFFWDTTINAVAAFNLLCEGLESDVQKPGGTATARA